MVNQVNEKTTEKNTVIKKRGRKPKKKQEENNDSTNDNVKNMNSENVVIKKKRGRKPKKKQEENETIEVKIPKKRGRKPKGGKIIATPEKSNITNNPMPNIILHLKCKKNNENNILSTMSYNPNISIPESYNIDNSSKLNKYSYEIIEPKTLKSSQSFYKNEYVNNNTDSINNDAENNLQHDMSSNNCENTYNNRCNNSCNNSCNNVCNYKNLDDNIHDAELSFNNNLINTNSREIWSKLKELQNKLHTNDISDKQSACFWCTYSFHNPAIFIPKFFINNRYEVYGCFCTPECAVAHLMNENIDSAIKFERYQFINHIYGEIYNYENNIKPAPNPHYLLDKFYGNLSITEYRKLLNRESLILIVDKPLTRVMPELYQDNSEIKTNIISDNKFSLKRKVKKKNKNNIITENFGFNN
jgi:hypothetical protein